MKTLKKFLIYFILFILMYMIVTFLTKVEMTYNYIDIEYNIESSEIQIDVEEAKATNYRGYIKGTVTNNTKEHIKTKYLKISLYNYNGTYLGSEYKELKYFNVNETMNFDIQYNKYSNVKSAKLSIVKEIELEQKNKNNKDINWIYKPNEAELKLAITISAVLVLQYIFIGI